MKFGVDAQHVILAQTSSTPLNRRLLDVHTTWVIYVPLAYPVESVQIVVVAKNITDTVKELYDMSVNVEVMPTYNKAEIERTLAQGAGGASEEEEDGDDGDEQGYPLYAIIVPSIAAALLLGVIVVYLVYTYTQTEGAGDDVEIQDPHTVADAKAVFACEAPAYPPRRLYSREVYPP